MSFTEKPLLEDRVRPEWVDYNGHMNDAEYARVFSMAVDRLMEEIGITADFRNQHQYSIYTLETHLCYLAEARVGQPLQVTVQLLDYDEKRLHVFFVMENGNGDRLATSEQMLMGIDMQKGRPAAFPSAIEANVKALGIRDQAKPKPAEAGRQIGIRKK
ncbi:thioesterase family protein [Scopulibacillus cellulosilyticus]|uniref:Thioesterase family protein n=1 Tax=Scopulibacillus cellulosilyticus TaxID=2665665 RepID=A0ABW2PTD1_9BACL